MEERTKNIALLGLSVVFCILSAEILLRTNYTYNLENPKGLLWSVRQPRYNLVELIDPSENWKIIYGLKPWLNTSFAGAGLITNSYGWRDKEPLDKGEGVIRVIGIGDSHMFGTGVEEKERYMDILERQLNERYPEKIWEVFVIAAPGYNLVMETEALMRYGLMYEPDIIIYGFVANDFCLPNFIVPRKDIFSCESFILHYITGRISKDAYVFLQTDEKGNLIENICKAKEAEPPYDKIAGEENWKNALHELENLSLESKSVIFLSPLVQAGDDNFEAWLDSLRVEYPGITFLSLRNKTLKYLKENNYPNYFDSDLATARNDAHPSKTGHLFKAGLILETLEEQGIIEKHLNNTVWNEINTTNK